jgi:Domain of unknown function (DUF4157)/DNA/RNA non-specific endonuclease
MSDLQSTIAKKPQNLDSTYKVSPFQARGFGVQEKAEESSSATNAETKDQLWENYQQAKQFTHNRTNTAAAAILPIQPKLTVGKPGDKYEQEADSMAAQVMQMPEPKLANSNIATSVQTRSIQPIQRVCTDCQEETKEESKQEEEGDQIQAQSENGQILEFTSVQRKLDSADDASSVPIDLEERLNSSKGGGSPLSDDVRSFMEPRFGADFSGVRVHTGSDSVRMNQDVNAQAFAHGQDVYFGAGKAPGKDALTAHELTHVVQQNNKISGLQRLDRLQKDAAFLPIQAKLTILQRRGSANGQPGDKYEQEADSMAANVMQMPEPGLANSNITDSVQTRPSIQTIQRACAGCQQESKEIDQIQAKEKVGAMPQTMASDLAPKQLSNHQLQRSSWKQNSVNPALMSQQAEGSAAITIAPKHVDSLQKQTDEAEPIVQRSSLLDSLLDFGEEAGWTIVGQLAPELVPILKKGSAGLFEWMKNLIGSSVEGIFSTLMAPIRSITGVEEQLAAHFAPLLASIQTAAGQISNNDCKPISEAAEKLQQAAESLITPIVEKLQPIVTKIKGFLSGIWDKIGAPIWGWIKDYAADQWKNLQMLGDQISQVTSWIWKATGGDKMWTWLKNKLGIGDGVEGQAGILQWIQRKVDEAWAVIKAKLEPFQKELTEIGLAVAAVAVAVSPAGPIIAIGAAVAGAVQGLRWIGANWGKGDMVVKSREYLEKSLIPTLQGAAAKLGATFKQMAGSISSALGNLAAGLMKAVGAIGGSFLKVAVSAIQWIADRVQALADWAQQQLNELTKWLEEAMLKLQTFLQRMLDFFMEVGKVVMDVWLLPAFLGKSVWTAIPECIRDPIVDFIGPIILRQIEIFQALASDKAAWQKTKQDVLHIVHLVFTDRDLMGAIKATFNLILRVFNIPPELLDTVIQKAENAWDVVSKDPLAFIKNVVRTIGTGFQLLGSNIGKHLKFGLMGWLTGGLADNKITLPQDWGDPKQVFGLVLDVMGLTADHMWELIKKHVKDEKKVEWLRNKIGTATRIIEWIDKAIDPAKSPAENTAGIIEQAKDFGSSVLTGIAEWIAEQVATELTKLAAAAAASGGLSEVLDVIIRVYKAIVTATRWARQILDMVNETLDDITSIASGNIAAAGKKLEDIMGRGMPVVIGFLADQVGLGGIGTAIKDIVTPLRAGVDKALDWVIELVKSGIGAVIGVVKSGVAALVEWWKTTKEFKANDGETHTLFFTGSDKQSTMMVASNNPKPYTQFLEWVEGNETLDDDKRKSIREAKEIAQKIEEEKGRSFGKGLSDAQKEQAQQEKQKNIEKLLKELSIPTAKLFGSDLPDWQEPELGNLNGANFGTWMKAKTLTKVKIGKGSEPTQARHGTYDILNKRRDKGGSASYYVRGHLLNEKLGGKGIWENMTPLSRVGNGEHETQFESLVKAALDSGAIIEYQVTPVYQERGDKTALKEEVDKHNDTNNAEIKAIIDAEDYVARSLTCHAQLLKKIDNKLQGIGSPRSWSVINQIDRNADDYFVGNGSKKKPEPININKAEPHELMVIPGITSQEADTIYNACSKRNKTFGQYRTLAGETNISEEKFKKLNKDGYIVLQ